MENILNGVKKGFIDQTINSKTEYIPELVVNEPELGKKVSYSIIKELKSCISFIFCVAFLNCSGVQTLKKTLLELRSKGIKGTIIVSEYLLFSEPKALRELKKFDNIDLRILNDKIKMHSKGYIFEKEDEYSVIVGSSNITQSALGENKEWNVILHSTKNGLYLHTILNEFKSLYEQSTIVTDEYIIDYEKRYNENKPKEKINYNILTKNVKPNKMQRTALETLENQRQSGEKKSLCISATGTGVTHNSVTY